MISINIYADYITYLFTEFTDWDTGTSSPAKKTASLPNVAEPDAGKTVRVNIQGLILLTVFYIT